MRGAQTAILWREALRDHFGKCSVTRPAVLDNHFRNAIFGYSSNKTGTIKGRNNWSGLLNGAEKRSRSMLEKEDQKMGNRVKGCDQLLSGAFVWQLVCDDHSWNMTIN